MTNEHGALMDTINETGNYNDDVEAQLKEAFDTFKSTQTW
jgi:F-type H+-transporting ATPase subunit alpha